MRLCQAGDNKLQKDWAVAATWGREKVSLWKSERRSGADLGQREEGCALRHQLEDLKTRPEEMTSTSLERPTKLNAKEDVRCRALQKETAQLKEELTQQEEFFFLTLPWCEEEEQEELVLILIDVR